MTEKMKESIFAGVDLNAKANNTEHHTSEISEDQLIVRRGQPFQLSLVLTQPFIPELYPFSIVATTGKHSTEHQGTKSYFGIPDVVNRSPSAKAVWKVELHPSSSQVKGILNLTITPPADTPIGEYILTMSHREEDTLLAVPVVLYNPWCPDDWVFLPDEKERQEYVMNEQGIVYKGSGNYIFPMDWDFGQFEDSMVSICMRLLDLNHKHEDDPADDVSARCNPIYVSRVVSAMINSEDDHGVLQGQWGGPYWGGVSPGHWSGSHAILKQWLKNDCHPVKYGQCWVFAAVMCSVMRLLGIPCRVVTNFESAHDNNMNLIIDEYHSDYGVREKPSHDSVWNYHVWVEGWMRRPDLDEGGKFDGWQVLDPTPQEKSDGVYCCGPAPVKAIHDGETDLKYDIPFVFAEVNADCIDWLVKADGTQVKILSDTKRVGQNISTKSVGSNKRWNITDTYKHREGSDKERSVYEYACTRDYSKVDEEETDDAENEEMEEDDENEEIEEEDENAADAGVTGAETEEDAEDAEMEEEPRNVETEEAAENAGTEDAAGNAGSEEAAANTGSGTVSTGITDEVTLVSLPPPPPVSLQFQEVTIPTNGRNVSLRLVLRSKSSVARPLSINISVQAMRYNGKPAVTIQTEMKDRILQPGKDLSIPILVPFSAYNTHMLDCDSMKVSALVTDKQNTNNVYLAEDDVVLLDPPIAVTVSKTVKVYRKASGTVVFRNPVQETLRDCTLTLSGNGLWREELQFSISDIKKNTRVRVTFTFFPYKTGEKTINVNFDCSIFRNIKGKCKVNVKPYIPIFSA